MRRLLSVADDLWFGLTLMLLWLGVGLSLLAWANVGRSEDIPIPACRVSVDDGGGMRSFGSGVLVAHDADHSYLMTNWHVVRERRGAIEICFVASQPVRAEVAAETKLWDLAILVCPRLKAQPVAIAATAPDAGETVIAGGFGPRGEWRVIEGQVTQYLSPDGQTFDVLEMSGAVRSGDSGGPIVNQAGELVGVLFGTDQRATMGSQVGRVVEFCRQSGVICGSGGCYSLPPGGYGPPAGYGPPPGQTTLYGGQRPVLRPPTPVARDPRVAPGGAQGNDAKAQAECACDPAIVGRVEKLEQSLARLEGLGATLENKLASGELRGPAGPPGPAGPAGRDGVDGLIGPPGPAGETPAIDLDELAAKLSGRLPAAKPQAEDIEAIAERVIERLPPTPAYFEIRRREPR